MAKTVTARVKPKEKEKTVTAMRIPSGWKKNERGSLEGGLAEYNKLKNKYGTSKGGLISAESMIEWDGDDSKAARKRKELVEKIEGSTRRETVGLRSKGKVYKAGRGYSSRSANFGASAQPHPYDYDKGYKNVSTEKNVEYPRGFKTPVRMKNGFKTYSPEKDKERVLKKVYDGMYVYGTQKKKK